MSTHGVIFIDLVGLGLIVLLLNLVRTQKLHVGLAAMWLVAVIALMTIVSVPTLMDLITVAVGATYPASAISLLAFVFIFVILILFSVQLSVLSARQVKIIQELALREFSATKSAPAHPDDPLAQPAGAGVRTPGR
jgi:hypothetical protein